jgi:DNA/RNA-binding domain of Phe-tRNA-synthetase-like protein
LDKKIKFPEIVINPDVAGKVLAAILKFSDLVCQEYNPDLWNDLHILSDAIRNKYSSPSDALAELRPGRDLYRAVGIEPTRIRPSSESLLRRVIKNKDLYQINSIVDVCNYASLSFLLPIGLYDLRKISGNVEFRLGRESEEYEGIRKDMIHVRDRLTLADDIGPFGNPSADSQRTAIDLKSRQVLMIIFAPAHYSLHKLKKHIEFSQDMMLKYHNGSRLVHSALLY